MIRNVLLTLCLLLIVGKCEQGVPIPVGGYGFSVGNPNGKLSIQFYLDFQCPDSLASYNTLIEVMRTISFQSAGVKLTYMFSPLAFHFYSFKIHQAFFYVWIHGGASAAESYISFAFKNQEKYEQENWKDHTVNEFLDEFSLELSQAFKMDRNELRKELQVGSDSFTEARLHWKFTSGEKGIGGAPLFYANQVRIDGAENWKANDWIDFIRQYKV